MLLSFKPEVYEKIKSGKKKFEHRRNFPDEPIIIFSVIDCRIRSGRPLIITTNLSLKEIKSETMLDKRRIYDRILEMCTPMYVGGASKREVIASMKMEKAKTLLNTNRGEEKCE